MTELTEELEREREYLRAAHARVQRLRDGARLVADQAGARVAADEMEPGAQFIRDVAVVHAAHRAGMLDVPADRLCVGRIDGDLAGEADSTLYIGRVAVSDEHGDPMIVDWRAPAAAAFYRARPGDPMGVQRRRHFRWRGGQLVGLDDEIVDRSALDRKELHLVGEAALLAALEAPRTSRMTDIVGTIQADQDRIIRRPARGVTVVQGGPGTGKTAVALHRAAYLLHELGGRGDLAAVLFIGPTDTFLRYVGDVVPSLGEGQMMMATAAELGPDVAVTGRDGDEAARIKGDARMARALERAVQGFEQPIRTTARIGCGRYYLELEPAAVRKLVVRTRRRGGTHNEGVRFVRDGIIELLAADFERRVRADVAAGRLLPGAVPKFRPVLDRAAVREVGDRVWPLLTPQLALGRLLASRVRLLHATKDLFAPDEAELLRRPISAGWTAADVALLDELDVLIGREEQDDGEASGRRASELAGASFQLVETALAEEMQAALENRTADCPRCQLELAYGRAADGTLTLSCTNPACPGGTWPAYDIIGEDATQFLAAVIEELSDRYAEIDERSLRVADRRFAHVVVDEAQDVSAMQWRAIARRCPSPALTAVGDLDQASQPWSIHDWGAVFELAGRGGSELVELHAVNYRTPAEVMAFAVAEVSQHGRAVSAPSAIRFSGVAPERRAGSVGTLEDLLAEARAAVGDAGTVVAVVPEALARPDDAAFLTATQTKGLEFDGVIVFDPAAIASESPFGATRLYVALTRTTRLLWVVDPLSDGDPAR